MTTPALHLDFPHHWRAQILAGRPFILPARRFAYPAQAEEVERGALEVLVTPDSPGSLTQHAPDAQSFLATCALGFADPAVPTGLWSTPKPEELCAVAGGYAYIIHTVTPERFTFLEQRPVLAIHPVPAANLLLFVGHHRILAWGGDGLAWNSDKLSDEGIAVSQIEESCLHGFGWNMLTDKQTPFNLDLRTGQRARTL
jgi:hypothetical protein